MPFVPKDQDAEIHGRLSTEYQANNGLIGNGLRLYRSTNNWYFMGAGSYRMAKNYQNTIDDRVYNTGFKETTGTLSMGYRSIHGKSSLNITVYNNLQGIPDGSRDSLTRRFTKQIYEGDQDDIRSRPLVSPRELDSYTLSPLHQHIQHYRIYSNNHYTWGKGSLDASLGWQQNIRREFNHPARQGQAGMHVRLNTVNYGLKYTLPVWTATDMTIGVNGMTQVNKNEDATDFPVPDYRLWDIGTFVLGKWKYRRLTISGGLRYDQRHLQGAPLYTVTNPNTGFEQKAAHDAPGARQKFAGFHKNFNGLSLSLGSTYAINPHVSLKANIARGYRAPNITELAANGLDPGAHMIYIGNRTSIPEFSFQQDLGIQLTYGDISGEVSLFNNAISHYIYLTEVSDKGMSVTDAQGNRTFQYQQSAARLYGLELTASIRPALWKGFTWTNNLTLCYGENTDPLFEDQGINGSYLPFIPPANWLSHITQILRFGRGLFSTLRLTAECDYHAAQNRYFGLYDTESATPAYTLVNISTGTSVRYKKDQTLQLQLAIQNLLNTAYQNHLSRLKYREYYKQSPSLHYGIYGPGRNICVKIIFSI